MLCDSLKHFSFPEISFNSRTFPTIYTEFEKAVLPLLGTLQGFRLDDDFQPTCLYEEMLYKDQE